MGAGRGDVSPSSRKRSSRQVGFAETTAAIAASRPAQSPRSRSQLLVGIEVLGASLLFKDPAAPQVELRHLLPQVAA